MYGVIDIGSNTIRLSIYKMVENSFKPMLNKKNMAGLAGYVDENGNLSNAGINKAIDALQSFKQILENIEVKDVFVFATASLRNINNTDDAVERITKATGLKIDLVSGEKEAVYGFVGATYFMELTDGVLIDIGGGSTELVFFKDGEIKKALSMPMGSLSMYSKYVDDIYPTKKEVAKIKNHVEEELKKLNGIEKYPIICGVGGTVRATCKLNNEIYEKEIKSKEVTAREINDLLETFLEDRKLAVKKIIKIVPDRIHTVIPGMIILGLLSQKFKSEKIIVSDYGVREGYLYSKLNLKE